VKNNKFFSSSKLLIPLSYAAILGGVTTLIGTSTNLIVNSLAIDAGLAPLKMFDFIYIGAPLAVTGVLYLTFFSDKLLPDHQPPEEKINSDYFLEARVLKGSSLIGKNLIKNRLRHLEKIFLTEIIRDERLISPVSPYEVIKENDTLVFTGEIGNFKDLERFDNLKIFGESDAIIKGNLLEVVVSHTSALVGKSIKDVNFRGQFDAAVVAVKHSGRKVGGKIGIIELTAGDVLVLAPGSDFYNIEANLKNFYFINPVKVNPRLLGYKAAAVVLLFLGAIAANALGLAPLFPGLLMVLFLFLVFRLTTAGEIQDRIDLDLVLLIGSAIGISEVMMSTGVSQWITDGISQLFHSYGAYGGFLGIYFTTFILTQLVTNNAAAALGFPLAFAAAISFEANPMPFVMAVAYGASASLLTPFGYQTNLLVYSAGNYKFTDYVKIGLPLSVIYSALVLILTPYFFPFYR
ncbi:MAG: SLC13 family permease, partial [Desulfobacteraceae bacterium]